MDESVAYLLEWRRDAAIRQSLPCLLSNSLWKTGVIFDRIPGHRRFFSKVVADFGKLMSIAELPLRRIFFLSFQMIRSFLIRLGYLLLEIFTFVIIAFPVIIAFAGIFEVFGLRISENAGINSPQDPYQSTLVEYIPQIIAFLTAFFVMRKYLFRRSFAEMGLTRKNLIPDLGKGFGMSVILIISGFVILLVLQKINYTGTVFNLKQFSGLLVLFLFQSWSEEIMSRGFLLATVAHYFGDLAGLIVSSLLFSLLHFFNPDFAWIGAANIFLAGVALGLLFLKVP